jgi:hypothetical protein
MVSLWHEDEDERLYRHCEMARGTGRFGLTEK